MQAIILAGGFGTRLRSVVQDVPKPMAPVNGRPFLAYVIDYLKQQGITEVVLSVHYLKEQIQQYFGNAYNGIAIQYAVEDEPLGTGGAIVKSLPYIDASRPIFVLNGDTFLKINYPAMLHQHQAANAEMTMSLRKIANCSRYGVVFMKDSRVIAFQEVGGAEPGLINAGVYLINPTLLANYKEDQPFSFERDFLFPQISTLQPQGFLADDYFIDIGVPEDYRLANKDFALF